MSAVPTLSELPNPAWSFTDQGKVTWPTQTDEPMTGRAAEDDGWQWLSEQWWTPWLIQGCGAQFWTVQSYFVLSALEEVESEKLAQT